MSRLRLASSLLSRDVLAVRNGLASRPPRLSRPFGFASTVPRRSSPSSFVKRLLLLSAGLGSATLAVQLLRPDALPRFATVLADAEPADDVVLDPTTQTPFPKAIVSPSGAKLEFIGSGVRTVSFLSIRVYAVAFYINSAVLRATPRVNSEAAMQELLERDDVEVSAIITPLRGTGLSHLRDGFARALMSRLKLPQVSGHLPPERVSQCNDRINEMKAFFPNRNMAKGSQLTVYMTKQAGSSLTFALGDPAHHEAIEVIGSINDPLLSRELFLSYFADKSPISEELKKSVFARLA